MEERNSVNYETSESLDSSPSYTDSSNSDDYKENPESSRKRLSVDFLYDNEVRPFKKQSNGFTIPSASLSPSKSIRMADRADSHPAYFRRPSMGSSGNPRLEAQIDRYIDPVAAIVLLDNLRNIAEQWKQLELFLTNQQTRTRSSLEKLKRTTDDRCIQCGCRKGQSMSINPGDSKWSDSALGPETICPACTWLYTHKLQKQTQFYDMYTKLMNCAAPVPNNLMPTYPPFYAQR